MDNVGIVIRLHASDEAVDWHVEQPYQLSFDDILVSTTYFFIPYVCLSTYWQYSKPCIDTDAFIITALSGFMLSCFILQDAIYQIANDDSVQAFECKLFS